jgi:hypothetical protein
VELLLNLTWLALSIALGVLLVASRSKHEAASGRCVHTRSTAWISYLVLIALLLPAISMTDDLMAMVAPADGEQITRRYDATAVGHHPVHFHVDLFHVVRDPSISPLSCIENLKSTPAFQSFFPPPRRLARGRAPPAFA